VVLAAGSAHGLSSDELPPLPPARSPERRISSRSDRAGPAALVRRRRGRVTVAWGCSGVGATGAVINPRRRSPRAGIILVLTNRGRETCPARLTTARRDLRDVPPASARRGCALAGPRDVSVLPAAAGASPPDRAGREPGFTRLRERFDMLLVARCGTLGGVFSRRAAQDAVVVKFRPGAAITESYAHQARDGPPKYPYRCVEPRRRRERGALHLRLTWRRPEASRRR
jgi:hypothetical protein